MPAPIIDYHLHGGTHGPECSYLDACGPGEHTGSLLESAIDELAAPINWTWIHWVRLRNYADTDPERNLLPWSSKCT